MAAPRGQRRALSAGPAGLELVTMEAKRKLRERVTDLGLVEGQAGAGFESTDAPDAAIPMDADRQ